MDKQRKKKIVATGIIVLLIVLTTLSLIKMRKNHKGNFLVYYYKFKLLIPSIKKFPKADFIKDNEEDFFLALKTEDLNTVEKLLKENRGLLNLNSDSKSPLEIAINTGNENLTALLIAAGADKKGAIHKSVEAGNVKMISFFLNLGMDVDSRWYDRTPLHFSAYLAEVECTEYLIKNGANINSVDKNNITPLHNAACQKWTYTHIDEQMIVTQKHNFRRKVGDYTKVIRLLINNGAKVNLKTSQGNNLLHIVASNNYHKISRIKDFEHPSRPDLDDVIDENIDITKLLINKGVEIEAYNEDGLTPLYVAIDNGNQEVANLLIEKGAILKDSIVFNKEKNKKKFYVLQKACYWGLYRVVKKLFSIENYANSDKTLKNTQPLHYTASFYDEEWTGIDNCFRNKIYKRKILIAKFLVSKGIDINEKTSDGKTPLDYAIDYQCPLLAKKLKKLGSRHSIYNEDHFVYHLTDPTRFIRTEDLGRLNIGMSQQEVVNRIGKPEEKMKRRKDTASNLYVTEWKYPKQGIFVKLNSKSKTGIMKVGKIRITSPCPYGTLLGLIGSPYDWITKMHSNYHIVKDESNLRRQVYGTKKEGLIYKFGKDDKVNEIILGDLEGEI